MEWNIKLNWVTEEDVKTKLILLTVWRGDANWKFLLNQSLNLSAEGYGHCAMQASTVSQQWWVTLSVLFDLSIMIHIIVPYISSLQLVICLSHWKTKFVDNAVLSCT